MVCSEFASPERETSRFGSADASAKRSRLGIGPCDGSGGPVVRPPVVRRLLVDMMGPASSGLAVASGADAADATPDTATGAGAAASGHGRAAAGASGAVGAAAAAPSAAAGMSSGEPPSKRARTDAWAPPPTPPPALAHAAPPAAGPTASALPAGTAVVSAALPTAGHAAAGGVAPVDAAPRAAPLPAAQQVQHYALVHPRQFATVGQLSRAIHSSMAANGALPPSQTQLRLLAGSRGHPAAAAQDGTLAACFSNCPPPAQEAAAAAGAVSGSAAARSRLNALLKGL